MEAQTQEKENILEIIVSILIAIVVVIGALVAWRASVIDDAAGDADYAGIRSAVNSERTHSTNYVNAYEAYGNYVSYWQNHRLSELITTDLETAGEDQVTYMEEQLSIANDLADANRPMFESRYLNRDGSYSVQRQLGEMWADASKQMDMDYDPKFAEADQLRGKSIHMLLALLIITLAPIFYSLVESVSNRLKFVLIVFGSLAVIVGTVLAILVEVGKF